MKKNPQRYVFRLFPYLALITFLVLTSCREKEVRRDENNSIIATVRSSDRVKIEYRVNGPESDTALIFIHEWLCNQTYWQNQIRYFATRFKVVTLDLAGHGRSGEDRDEWTLDRYADDVMAVIKKVKASRVYLVGHSLGGAVAVKVALKMPEKVIVIFGVDTFQNLTFDYPSDQIEKFMAPYRDDFRNTVKKHASVLFHENADRELVERVMNDWSSANPKMAVATMIEYLRFKPTEWTKGFQVPIISLNSAKFPPNEEGNKLVLKNYRMVPLQNVGHFPQLEDPKYFNGVLWAILFSASQGTLTF